MADERPSSAPAEGGDTTVGGDAGTIQSTTVGGGSIRDMVGSITNYYHGASLAQLAFIALSVLALIATGLVAGLFIASLLRPAPAAGTAPTSPAGVSAAAMPQVALAAASFEANDYDPRLIDLRKAASSGLPVGPGSSLRLFQLGVAAPADAPGHTVRAEVSVGTEIVATTGSAPIRAGISYLPEVETVELYRPESGANMLFVRQGWDELALDLVIAGPDGQEIGRHRTPIRLDPAGGAWLRDLPNPRITAAVYSVNDGPRLLLDLRGGDGPIDATRGLGAVAGDTLTLHEVWYFAEAAGDNRSMRVEARLGRLFSPETTRRSQDDLIRKGFVPLANFTPMSWTLAEDSSDLLIHLIRDDDAQLDLLIIPVGPQGAPGLAPFGAADALPGQVWRSFEDGSAEGWEVRQPALATIAITTTTAHSGLRSLSLNTSIQLKDEPTAVAANLGPTTPRGGLAVRIYVPAEAPGEGQLWANLYTMEGDGYRGSTARALVPGRWVTLVWAAEDVRWEGDAVVGIQVGTNGTPYEGPVFIDDLQLFIE